MILTCSRVRPTAFLYNSCAFLLCRPCPQRDCRSHGPRLQCLHHRHPGIQKIATSRHCHSHHSTVCKGSQRLTSLDALKWDGHRDGLWLCKHSCSWEMLRSLSNSPHPNSLAPVQQPSRIFKQGRCGTNVDWVTRESVILSMRDMLWTEKLSTEIKCLLGMFCTDCNEQIRKLESRSIKRERKRQG